MKRLTTLLIAAAVLAVGTGFALGTLAAQEPQDAGTPPRPAELKVMNQDLGSWNAAVKVWMAPGAPPMEMTGVETNKWDCHGMWMVSTFDSTDGSFSGRSIGGWDPLKKQYVGVWADSWTPELLFNAGTHDKDSNTMHFSGEMTDQASGKRIKTRSTLEYPEPNMRKYTSWSTSPDGQETKNLEIVYTRAK